MSTDVDIASRALRALGANPIASLGESSPEAETANAFYEPTVAYLLSVHRWNFALETATLVEIVPPGEDPIVPGWDHAYTAPAGLIRI